MILTRSIRRKLAVHVALVICVVALPVICSVIGVASYRRMVSDLELSITNVPRRDELIASVSSLLKPFSVEFPSAKRSEEIRQRAAQWQYEEFVKVFRRCVLRVRDFEKSWQQLPASLSHDPREEIAYTTMFSMVESRLYLIQGGIGNLADPDQREAQVSLIIQTVAEVIEELEKLPDPANRLGALLQEAKQDYLFYLRLVAGMGVLSCILVMALMAWSWALILSPIRKLHLGVKRLAAGNYSYRLDVGTSCELSYLAHAFNEMANTIQEDRADKERQIEERSKQLVLSERLAGAGFLASGVAHEINNPLAVIMGAASGLESILGGEVLNGLPERDQNDIREYLVYIQQEAERCEGITRKLLDFSHGKGEERNLYDVTAIVEEVVGMVGHLSRYQDRTVTVNTRNPLRAWINSPEIKQVILNLVANALDATDPGGHVDIFLSDHNEEVEVAVQDDGCGMTPEQLSHLFEPFFTTKDVGKGTGLGLAITQRIVVDHGGTLDAHSSGPGQGSRFSLRLPKREMVVKAA
ncbi:MAG: HAMP domain-containing histidine kinase [Planctomycetaceae bacterium]|nr:HAMP domain-containing histidine kinase [Planctomycetaceae bacterium]